MAVPDSRIVERWQTTFAMWRSSGTICTWGLHVPLDDMGIVETIHLAAFHWVVDDLYRRISM